MKKLIFALLLIGCTSQKELTTTTYYNQLFSPQQVDSIVKAESIDRLDSIPLRGSKSNYWEYYYLKDSLVIRFIDKGDSIKVTKRINK